MPDWRKNTTSFTAFVEGWGLYSERLGIEMGLYDTPQNDMGRLGYEMWRAARLVVDTGLHAKGWDKARAVKFFKDNSTLTDANIDAEVNRYISTPGQALAYKMGELEDSRVADIGGKGTRPQVRPAPFPRRRAAAGAGAARYARGAGPGVDRRGKSQGLELIPQALYRPRRLPCAPRGPAE